MRVGVASRTWDGSSLRLSVPEGPAAAGRVTETRRVRCGWLLRDIQKAVGCRLVPVPTSRNQDQLCT